MSKVAVVMGSVSDWETMKESCKILEEFKIEYTKEVVSAHRMPEEMMNFAKDSRQNGYSIIIAGAGGAAHLPGMIASLTTLPVLGVPIQSKSLNGIDSLLSIVQMPGGVPVATLAIGTPGAKNAGLFAVRILANDNTALSEQLEQYQKSMNRSAVASNQDLKI